ncbi:transcriptional regulator [Virgisporangium aliadipatigenens]|uniref:Transcriptional regulator n=1 Tax=Virgisporangium aliadipatigenens TaxID=741659 RepID=A0A8J3YR11_9ACTN|nr:WYL domain-containing protein [Virgisporangium aliadipatigenens]GIJ49022.1 transcriptional regulator [Virgisporangium aliadipatigenens]
MRADRLVAVLLLMQSRGRVTAADVAHALEVSVATARRDLAALAAAGVPVYPQPGRGGGWSLVGGARTDLSGLTAGEARALFLLVGRASAETVGRASAETVGPAGAETVGRAGRGGELGSALRKLMRALPGTFRAEAEAAAAAVTVDPAAWGDAPRDRPAAVTPLQEAVIARQRLRFAYPGGTGKERRADPLGLAEKDGVWYLIADTPEGQRTFRVDRIHQPHRTGETFEQRADFDLATEWGAVVEAMERRRSGVRATVLAEPRHARIIRDHFGRHCDVLGEEDGRVRMTVRAHLHRSVAEQLAGWGSAVEVVEPDEVRAELARIGRELTGAYAPPSR